MKKILSLILALALMCGCMLTLASCGELKLEGTYSGSFISTYPEDSLTIKIGKDKSVEYTLVMAGGSETKTAKGSYSLVDDGHGHGEMLKLAVDKDADVSLLYLNGNEYQYSLKKVNGKKVLTLTGHDNDYFDLTLTEVK